MDNKQFNEQRHNRRKQLYHITLGFQQMINYPVINLIWILFAICIGFLIIGEKKLVLSVLVYPILAPVFDGCLKIVMIIFPVICAIGIIQFVGLLTAVRDEADLSIVFGDKRDVKNQPPILIYKKRDKKSGVIKREFYTTIPMERWQERKDAICDRMDIHIIGDITYGGKKKNKGHQIYFESAKGRNPIERGVLYDDTF